MRCSIDGDCRGFFYGVSVDTTADGWKCNGLKLVVYGDLETFFVTAPQEVPIR